ncbi:Cytidine and deoxycytidylate deaminase zinc-binding region [compost metagenome]
MTKLLSALNQIYRKNDDFIFIGLTGRTGSGCTTVSKILSSEFNQFNESIYTNLKGNDFRKNKILFKSLEKNWIPFITIQVRSIITLIFSLEKRSKLRTFLKDFLKEENIIIDNLLLQLAKIRRLSTNVNNSDIKYIDFYANLLPILCDEIRSILGNDKFIELYQMIGKNLRASGSTITPNFSENNFFTLAKRIEEVCKEIFKFKREKNQKTAIVVDALRNPLEALYFQDRYASFYLMAISCAEDERLKRLKELGYSAEGINLLDRQEGTGQDIDDVDYYSTQNIPACLQRSDIYINNSFHESNTDIYSSLKRQIVRFISLMHTPGIVTPSATERCMQIAYTAKLNSGCISRQVGAVVTDDNYSVKSIGWNDVPSGHVSCNLRNRFDLTNKIDQNAYSDFEKENLIFKNHISSKNKLFTKIIESGRNPSYCFKSEYKEITGKDNQVHTRALHAEENAFLQVSKHGGMPITGGYLFSTASPCELCAKKSVQLGIKKIYYVDPYPGISNQHIINGGNHRPQMKIFIGAIGRAFHNLYSPVLPYKDELSAFMK